MGTKIETSDDLLAVNVAQGRAVHHAAPDAALAAKVARDRAAGVTLWVMALLAPPAEIVAFALTTDPIAGGAPLGLRLDAVAGYPDEQLSVVTTPLRLERCTSAMRAPLEALPRDTPLLPVPPHGPALVAALRAQRGN